MKVRTEAKREAILEVASEVFLEMGYERASMAEIATRVGGSKATLYGYFPSKEALFVAVSRGKGAIHMEAAVAELSAASGDEPVPVLQRFGEKILIFACLPSTLATMRMVFAESGRSDVGKLFFESGPKFGLETLSAFVNSAMEAGHLRRADPLVAAQHFVALVTAETRDALFYRDQPAPTRHQIKLSVERAMATFVGGYGA